MNHLKYGGFFFFAEISLIFIYMREGKIQITNEKTLEGLLLLNGFKYLGMTADNMRAYGKNGVAFFITEYQSPAKVYQGIYVVKKEIQHFKFENSMVEHYFRIEESNGYVGIIGKDIMYKLVPISSKYCFHIFYKRNYDPWMYFYSPYNTFIMEDNGGFRVYFLSKKADYVSLNTNSSLKLLNLEEAEFNGQKLKIENILAVENSNIIYVEDHPIYLEIKIL